MDLKQQISDYSKRIETVEQSIKTLKATLVELKAVRKMLERANAKAESIKQ